ncbi:hypothetical protein [Pedomonas mirosovicensis]|uniref:hypothetical protein n=1 Tax=Pedomonas mirosovicensis TaxID=2908641 RepID=UPI002167F37B|nr:hypothetical protein [Pedomonas mirosovicensis]MCH8683809.1 hypothetical protein [Pedomonas mirosovicensis]
MPDLPEETEWVEVGRFSTLAEAQLARAMLEAYGLTPGIEGENSAHVLAGIDPTMRGVILHVPAQEAEQATNLLKESPPGPVDGDDTPEA